jgi:hypothetical protein
LDEPFQEKVTFDDISWGSCRHLFTKVEQSSFKKSLPLESFEIGESDTEKVFSQSSILYDDMLGQENKNHFAVGAGTGTGKKIHFTNFNSKVIQKADSGLVPATVGDGQSIMCGLNTSTTLMSPSGAHLSISCIGETCMAESNIGPSRLQSPFP